MNFLDNIKNETIIICNNYYKNIILSMNKLLPIKIYTQEEFMKLFYFNYDETTIIYIVNKYNIKYDVALEYINNLYYIEDKKYNIKKLDFLVNIKKELMENNLLIFNNYFKDYIKNKKIIIYGYFDRLFISHMLNGYDYKFKERVYDNYEHPIYEFNTLEEEIEYVAAAISSLIDHGIDINNIKLMNIQDSYINTLSRIFSYFNLKIDYSYKSKLSSYEETKKFIKNISEYSLGEAINSLDKKFIYYDDIMNIINKYIKYNDSDLLIYKLENSYITSKKYKNSIEIVDYLEYIANDYEYIFLLGFNNGIIPNYYKDINYITDEYTSILHKENTRNLNIILNETIIKNLNSIKNLTITYKLRDNKNKYTISNLFNNPEILKKDINYDTYYGGILNKINLGILHDNYIKYGESGNKYEILNANYKIPYNTYDNKYKKIQRLEKYLYLSYSKMNTYNKCAFRYYLGTILKLDIYEENFSTIIGSMVHYVMEKCLSNNDLNPDKYSEEFLKGKSFNNKEIFFLGKYKLLIKELLNECIQEKEYMSFDKAMYEKKIEIKLEDNVTFNGIIDKILYINKDNNTYISLIDYKTGFEEINLEYLKYGLNMQLPIYLYLSRTLEFKNPIYTGFYLQKFDIKDKDYRLVGYSNSDKEILSIIDKNYDNSKIIKSLKTLKDGSFSKYSKVISNSEIDNIINITEKKIKETVSNIKDNSFNINPKVINGVNYGCNYCKFKDICYMKEEDKVIINSLEGCE